MSGDLTRVGCPFRHGQRTQRDRSPLVSLLLHRFQFPAGADPTPSERHDRENTDADDADTIREIQGDTVHGTPAQVLTSQLTAR